MDSSFCFYFQWHPLSGIVEIPVWSVMVEHVRPRENVIVRPKPTEDPMTVTFKPVSIV